MTEQPEPCDFIAHAHGTVWRIVAASDAAKQFARENFATEGWQGTPENFATDWRPASDLCERLLADGFTVDGR